MLIIYPTNNWNSFGSLQDLTAVMGYQFPDSVPEFNKMTPEQQTALAMNAGTWIRTCKGIKFPSPMTQDFMSAQVAIMVQNMGNAEFMNFDPNQRAITKEKVGDLEVEYDPKYKHDAYDIHPLIYRYLSPYGCSGNKGFSQSPTVKA